MAPFDPLARRLLVSLSLLALCAQLTACSGCKRKPPAPKVEGGLEEPVAAPVEEVDPGDEVFRAVAERCEVTSANQIKNCQGEEYDAFITYVRSQGIDIVPRVTEGLVHGTTTQRQISAQILRDFIPTVMATAHEDRIAEGDARALLQVLQDQNPVSSTFGLAIAAPVISLATLKGLDAEVRQTIQGFDPSSNRATMWMHLATLKGYASQARLDAFDLIRGAAEDERPEMKGGAIEAAMAIPDWSEEEAATLCEWVSTMIDYESGREIKDLPSKMLLQCPRDTWHEALVEQAEARVKAKTYARPFVDHFRFTCPKNPELSTREDELCARQYELLLRVSKSEDFPEAERKYALAMIGDRFIDEKTVADLTQISKTRSAEIAQFAKTMSDRVSKRLEAREAEKIRLADPNFKPVQYGPGEGG